MVPLTGSQRGRLSLRSLSLSWRSRSVNWGAADARSEAQRPGAGGVRACLGVGAAGVCGCCGVAVRLVGAVGRRLSARGLRRGGALGARPM
ncbi:hypothetical protein [Pyrobaculum ferrireducens]|uniref:hypothetical protein n=1 Tax=Pyrobaculum ferrireducens TaxID=1104324 RepID=UPI0011E55D6A|nr:hypothetical protein [Pyrobaculum ferrireducens]